METVNSNQNNITVGSILHNETGLQKEFLNLRKEKSVVAHMLRSLADMVEMLDKPRSTKAEIISSICLVMQTLQNGIN